MARTIQEIQDEIIASIQADPVLSGLSSPSAVAIWRLITRVVAGALETEEQLNDVYREELEQIAREAIPGTSSWLAQRVLEFQYSATSPQVVQVIDGRVTYPVIDESLRIIEAVAIKTQANQRGLVKCAKDDGAGGLEPLSPAEKLALEAYIDRIAFVGVPIDVISQQADRLRIQNLQVYYSRDYTLSAVQTAVEEAVTQYIKDISSVNFDGIINKVDLIDRIQAVEGVVTLRDYALGIIIRDFATTAPNGTFILVQGETQAGYAVPEDTPGYTLADSIEYFTDDLIPTS